MALAGRRRRAVDDFSQVHRTTRLQLLRRLVEKYILLNRNVMYQALPTGTNWDVRRLFGRRIAVLKEPGGDGERGVLFMMFSEMLSTVFRQMDVPRLLVDYTIVSEPSWSGYCDEDFLRYMQFDEDVFVLSAQADDLAFLERARTNLIPVPLGPCDWVDPRVAEPYISNPKAFDIVMNSNWAAWKRHHVLFRMLRRAKRKYSVALIGGGLEGRTDRDIYELADLYGVRDQLTVYERIPYSQVMDVTSRARVSILLSLKEGSNRAMAESIFCNVPVIVLKRHVGGIVKNVVPDTGLLVAERHLEHAVERLRSGGLKPREWGLANASCFVSTERLNTILKTRALAVGRPWTRDIALRANSPESKYVDPTQAERLKPWNDRLRDYLRVPTPADRL